jgi:putative membrane protein
MDRVIALPWYSGITRITGSIFVVWLFHISSLVGVSLGYQEWFISKTPLHLLVLAFLVIISYPIDTKAKALISGLFFVVGMFVEWLGVHSGVLFGEYVYGSNLGVMLDGVPLLIGVNWAVLTLITGSISNGLNAPIVVKALAGAGLMLFLDLFIEVAAPQLDYWTFVGGVAPLENYLMWFAVGFGLQLCYQLFKMKGDMRFSLHLYAAQLVFFVFFYGIYGL